MCGTFSPGASQRVDRARRAARAPPRRSCSVEASNSSCMPEADAEHRHAGGERARASARRSPASRRLLHRLRERADAGQRRAPSAARSASWSRGRSRVARRRARAPSRPSAVAHPVVDDRDRASRRSVSVPLRRRHAGLVGSIATACAQRARERLERRLDHVVGVRARARTLRCSVSLRRVRDRAEELLGQLGSKPPIAARRQVGLERRSSGRPEMSIAHERARLVHRHDGVAVAGDAARGRRAPGRAPGRARCRCPRRCGARRSRGRP